MSSLWTGRRSNLDVGVALESKRMEASMLFRLCLAILLLFSIVSLSPLASAYPPDPLWIPGIYDGEDQDDVVGLATWGVHAVVRRLSGSERPLFTVVATIFPPEYVLAVDIGRWPFQGRAPPIL